ncbi:hypothetical protein C8Q74DRAFT_1241575 [Fomes fomentarius]|nr:hypothetical protein C8Q74DRAFT_1241575 [Fomes fomentarius]
MLDAGRHWFDMYTSFQGTSIIRSVPRNSECQSLRSFSKLNEMRLHASDNLWTRPAVSVGSALEGLVPRRKESRAEDDCIGVQVRKEH